MDKYFIFVDENFIQVFLVSTTGIIFSYIVWYLCEKYLNFKYGGLIFFLWTGGRFFIGSKIMNDDSRLFINNKINSVITEQVEWRAGCFRNRLRNGITFYRSDIVFKNDSIVKEEESNKYKIYRMDYSGKYEFLKEDTY